MEANEALRRIIWRHRWLLIVCLLLPVAAIVPLRIMAAPSYSATASFQAQSSVPDVDTQAQAILSRVTAVATSQAVVHSAIASAQVSRESLQVAKHEIAVTSLGSSAVIVLTITDPSPQVAIRLAGSLATAVVSTLNKLGTQEFTPELVSLNQQRTQLNSRRAHLLDELTTANSAHESSTTAAVGTLLAELNAVEAEIQANQVSEQQILSAGNVNGSAGIISAPSIATRVSSHLTVYAALAVLLGLIVGLVLATSHELAKPSVAEPAAGARELGLPMLGSLQLTGGTVAGLDEDLPTRLDLATQRIGARTLVLAGPIPPPQLAELSVWLTGELGVITRADPADDLPPHPARRPVGLPSLAGHMRLGSDSHRHGPDGESWGTAIAIDSPGRRLPVSASARSGIRAMAVQDLSLGDLPENPALVVVIPEFAPHGAMVRIADLGVTAGWPILGVLGVRRRRKLRSRKAKTNLAVIATQRGKPGLTAAGSAPGEPEAAI